MRGTVSKMRVLLLVFACIPVESQSSYRYGSLSWMKANDPMLSPNTVDFELVTGWRYDFNWVYVSLVSGRSVNDPNLRPMIGDVLRITGLTFAEPSGQTTQSGTSEIVFQTGDGAKYFVDVTVTAYSVSENWLMGTTKIRHTYARPFFARGQNIYPTNYSFEAGTGEVLDVNQPYENIPYKASFSGCCRLGINLNDPNSNDPYRLETFVDLTDRDNAPASRSLPVITVQSSSDYFYIIARDQYMKSSDNPISMSGGNTNYPVDDNMASNTDLKYYVASALDLGLSSTVYTPLSWVAINPISGKVTFSSPRPNNGIYQLTVAVKSSSSSQCDDRSSATCQCMTSGAGCSKTIIDFMVQFIGSNDPQPTICGGVTDTGYQQLTGWVGYRLAVPVCVMGASSASQLILNYVFSGLAIEASSLGTNAAGEFGVITYSSGELNGQGLPVGASLFSTADSAIVDIQLSLDNPFDAHRPGHDWAVGKEQRDYVNAPGAQALWDAGYRPVYRAGKTQADLDVTRLTSTLSYAAFDLNSGTGGAAVYMWLRRSSTEGAITHVNLSTSPLLEDTLQSQGFTKLPVNLNEQAQSAVPAIFFWYKKGTGPAIVDVLAREVAVEGGCPSCTPPAGADPLVACPTCVFPSRPNQVFNRVPGDANDGTPGKPIELYVRRANQTLLQRRLEWTPQVPGHYVFCYAGTDVNRSCTGSGPAACSSDQRCVDMNVTNDPSPRFSCGSQCSLTTNMGQMLHFNVSFLDIPHPDESVTIRPYTQGLTLDGAVASDVPTKTPVGDLWQTTQQIAWFPPPSYGGFSGHVCFTGTDTSGPYRQSTPTTGCVSVTVHRCLWFVQGEDSLIQIAARFSTNWLQVWHLNPTLLHPDDSLQPGSLVNIGHLYEVEQNDELGTLASRFGTSIAHINANNWDLANQPVPSLPVGKHICVIPSSCKTAANVVHV